MMKRIRTVAILLLSIFMIRTAVEAANLVSGTLEALDSAGIARNPAIFNNSERIGFKYSVTNTQSSAADIVFTFTITDPQSREVLSQTGNAISGTQVGEGGTSIQGIVVAQFYTVPGNYELKGTAKFSDGSETVSATLAIQIFSPLLNLTYPPNNSQNLTDQPLTFRWIGTGATKYRIKFADNPALFNPLLTDEVVDTQFQYPANPSDSRQKLASGQAYYWSVAGLDSLGTKTSEADFPFSFTVGGGASQPNVKDLAIILVEPSLVPAPSKSQSMVEVTVKNQGGRPESGVTVSAYVQGLLQEKKTIESINSLEEVKLTFAVYQPENRAGSGFLVSVTLEGFFDDNLMNNTKTVSIPWPKIEDPTLAKAKILGSVLLGASGNKKAGEGAVVSYEGPIKGRVTTNAGGEYKIEDLPIGDYTLTAKYNNLESAQVIIAVTEGKSYANRDLRVPDGGGVAGSTTTARADDKDKDKDKDKEKKKLDLKGAVARGVMKAVVSALPVETAKGLKGYALQTVNAPGMNEAEVNEILAGLADGSVKILSAVMQ